MRCSRPGGSRPLIRSDVWGILAGSAVGLVAATTSRLYGVAHYALGDTKRPLRFTLARLALATALGYVGAVLLPGWVGLDPKWGAAGLTASAGIAGWVELLLLRRSLRSRVGEVSPPAAYLLKIWIVAAAAGLVCRAVHVAAPGMGPLVTGALVVPLYGALFLAGTRVAGLPFAGRLPR